MAAKDLESAIAAWEANVEQFEGVTADKFPEANRRMSMEDMCPVAASPPRAQGRERYATCDELRIAMSDWLYDEGNKKTDKSLNSVEDPGSPA